MILLKKQNTRHCKFYLFSFSFKKYNFLWKLCNSRDTTKTKRNKTEVKSKILIYCSIVPISKQIWHISEYEWYNEKLLSHIFDIHIFKYIKELKVSVV